MSEFSPTDPSAPRFDAEPRAPRPFLWGAAASALVGAVFSALSTSDFVKHLDRQVHSIHCSFIPGAGAELGESGCRTVMLSPYSSILRDSLWGGLPISLLSLAVFAYLVMRATRLALASNVTRRETLFLLAATALPVVMSLGYGYIAATKIGAVCKLCVGVYAASALAFAGALVAHLKAPRPSDPASPTTLWVLWFGEGAIYVGALVGVYLAFAPVTTKPAAGCGALAKSDDPNGILLHLGKSGGTPAIAVVDPLCPACRNFDARLRSSGHFAELQLDAVLFPLDASCNWMVKDSLHPGACAVSEAMLCDRDASPKILEWAFENQESLRDDAKEDEAKVRARLVAAFPGVRDCLGTAAIRNKLNKSLRWAVANALPVLTPQLFVAGRRVCDEDTDLGLEFTVARMLASASAPESK